MLRRRRKLTLLVLQLLLRALSKNLILLVNRPTFPVPGGPNKSIPRAGSRNPENKSGRKNGYITVSFKDLLASSRPAID